jgi:hypothetical protein
MKGDFTRTTFDPAKHYQQVLMQQGRAQVDADWNEQAALGARRDETTTADVVGDCGGPAEAAAFAVFTDAAKLSTAEVKNLQRLNVATPLADGDFFLGAGRYYVDGIQCENELAIPYMAQPDRLDVTPLAKNKSYVLYLDVWQRHLTAVDDRAMREMALGGPDTATRVKTVWQVRALEVGALAADPCATGKAQLDNLADPGTALLTADTVKEQAPTDPCLVPASAGYTGLENQLYRVEIHEAGGAVDIAAAGTMQVTLPAGNDPKNQITVTAAGFALGQAVELYPSKAGSPKMKGQLVWITGLSGGGKVLALSSEPDGFVADDQPRLRPVKATWKWSRENGSVVAAIEKFGDTEITVSSVGPDRVVGFVEDAWVEILDDALELEGKPGRLLQIAEVVPDSRVIKLRIDKASLAAIAATIKSDRHPKVRRWEGVGAVKFAGDPAINWLPLESGVQVRFADGSYRTGHWWQIAARTATAHSPNGDIEWPTDGTTRRAMPPRGITHHICRLATVTVPNAGPVTSTDCRCLFPALTTIPRMFYVSGDGQEVMPDQTTVDGHWKLPQPLIVGVANPHCLDRTWKVRFTVMAASGGLVVASGGAPAAATVDIVVDSAGLASCDFHLDPTHVSQRVMATLLDASNQPVSLPIIFNANLSIASQVAYDPGSCAGLQGQKTVQAAIARLASVAHLEMRGGDGQDVDAGAACDKPLVVSVSSKCGMVANASVKFEAEGTGVVASSAAGLGAAVASVIIQTDANGLASCFWKPGSTPLVQQVKATLTATPTIIHFEQPDYVQFTANVRKVATGGGCCVDVGEGGQYDTLEHAFKALLPLKKPSICLSLLAGEHKVEQSLVIPGGNGVSCVTIEGCSAECTHVVLAGGPIVAKSLKLFRLANLTIASGATALLECGDCVDVIIDGCQLSSIGGARTVSLGGAKRIRIADSEIISYAPAKSFAVGNIPVAVMGAAGDWPTLMTSVDVASTGFAKLDKSAVQKGVAALVKFIKEAATGDPKAQLAAVERTFATVLSAPIVLGNAVFPGAAPSAFRAALVEALSGTALAIADAGADTRLVDNHIFGAVQLYGFTPRLAPTAFTTFAKDLVKQPIAGSGRMAHLRGNTLTDLVASDTITKSHDRSTAVYTQIAFAENVVLGVENQFLARGLTMTGNMLHGIGDGDVALVGADFASIAGNAADASVAIRCTVPDPVHFLREQQTVVTNIPRVL